MAVKARAKKSIDEHMNTSAIRESDVEEKYSSLLSIVFENNRFDVDDEKGYQHLQGNLNFEFTNSKSYSCVGVRFYYVRKYLDYKKFSF